MLDQPIWTKKKKNHEFEESLDRARPLKLRLWRQDEL